MLNSSHFRFRGGSPGPGGGGGPSMASMAGMMRPRHPNPAMFNPSGASSEPEEIVIEDDNDAPVVISQRRAPVPRGGPRGRGGRRGRPRLDPDTDLGNNFTWLEVSFLPIYEYWMAQCAFLFRYRIISNTMARSINPAWLDTEYSLGYPTRFCRILKVCLSTKYAVIRPFRIIIYLTGPVYVCLDTNFKELSLDYILKNYLPNHYILYLASCIHDNIVFRFFPWTLEPPCHPGLDSTVASPRDVGQTVLGQRELEIYLKCFLSFIPHRAIQYSCTVSTQTFAPSGGLASWYIIGWFFLSPPIKKNLPFLKEYS